MSQSRSSTSAGDSIVSVPGAPRIEPLAARCAWRASMSMPSARATPPSISATATMRAPARSSRRAAWKPTFPSPWTITRLPSTPRLSPSAAMSSPESRRLSDADGDALAGGRRTPRDAVQRQWLARDAGIGVEQVWVEDDVGVGDPGHFLLARAVVRCGHVHGRPDQTLAIELGGVATGDALQKARAAAPSIDADAALRAAERHLDQRAL